MIQARIIFLEKNVKYNSTAAIFIDNRVTKTTLSQKLK
jgi:hypothetical protein